MIGCKCVWDYLGRRLRAVEVDNSVLVRAGIELSSSFREIKHKNHSPLIHQFAFKKFGTIRTSKYRLYSESVFTNLNVNENIYSYKIKHGFIIFIFE